MTYDITFVSQIILIQEHHSLAWHQDHFLGGTVLTWAIKNEVPVRLQIPVGYSDNLPQKKTNKNGQNGGWVQLSGRTLA
jgi:hypothetical protein